MRVLKSICRKNKISLFFSNLIPGGNSAGCLFICLIFPLLPSCVILWPLHADRDYSLSVDEKRSVRDIDRSYVINLLEMSQSRYLELQKAGGEYCIPGQMSIIHDLHQLAIYEIDGDLLGDASNRLSESFSTLERVRLLMEAMAEDGGCPLQYAAGQDQKGYKPLRSDDSALGLSDWPRPVNLRLFMREPQ
ncbi:hypothetical protein [Endozoicomonas sp. GU-1]|uniref:hypothetical protein n=1 Tax=Endozoicomonas sp. GU-1 TaxID=3009078 RepID=UPI0022B2BD18|nr:hypothetical protein [Endozoicomonas sp. GU-1]WBA83042.1 hypothetical protein O2T12_07940 [Endozoicomonas sp. GU-1]WBA85964.1 hypothetical protein O3276_22575 [Endozoicomonas sp. GU-1]